MSNTGTGGPAAVMAQPVVVVGGPTGPTGPGVGSTGPTGNTGPTGHTGTAFSYTFVGAGTAVAVAAPATGPAGVHSQVQTWLAVTGPSGSNVYIPCY